MKQIRKEQQSLLSKADQQFNRLAKITLKALNKAETPEERERVKLNELDPLPGETWNNLREVSEKVRKEALQLEDQIAKGEITEALAHHRLQIIGIMADYLDARCNLHRNTAGKRPASEIYTLNPGDFNPVVPGMKPVKAISYSEMYEPMVGKKFNQLTVMAKVGVIDRRSVWLCRCECGTMGLVRAQDVKSGNTKSCGCYQVSKSPYKSQEEEATMKKAIEIINDKMQERGISTTQLSVKAGIKEDELKSSLSGERELRASELIYICRAMDLDLRDFKAN